MNLLTLTKLPTVRDTLHVGYEEAWRLQINLHNFVVVKVHSSQSLELHKYGEKMILYFLPNMLKYLKIK